MFGKTISGEKEYLEGGIRDGLILIGQALQIYENLTNFRRVISVKNICD